MYLLCSDRVLVHPHSISASINLCQVPRYLAITDFRVSACFSMRFLKAYKTLCRNYSKLCENASKFHIVRYTSNTNNTVIKTNVNQFVPHALSHAYDAVNNAFVFIFKGDDFFCLLQEWYLGYFQQLQ